MFGAGFSIGIPIRGVGIEKFRMENDVSSEGLLLSSLLLLSFVRTKAG